MDTAFLFLVVLAVVGAGIMMAALVSARRNTPGLDEFLGDIERAPYAEELREPLLRRLVIGPASRKLDRLLPGTYLANVKTLLAQAGLAGTRTAGQQVAIQLACTAAGAALAALILLTQPRSGPMLGVLLLPAIGFMVPTARLKRAARARADEVFKDLPDMIDMLAVAVEAGSGFEAAMGLVCERFRSPMATELSFALNEMALGMPRREALQGLRERVDLDVVRTFTLALIQADALGIPISRVLKTQATEIRARRRAWAREKAAKMPVKILFPLVLFVFPPILAVVLGPAALSLTKM